MLTALPLQFIQLPEKKSSEVNFIKRIKYHQSAREVDTELCQEASARRSEALKIISPLKNAEESRKFIHDYIEAIYGFLFKVEPEGFGAEESSMKHLIYFYWSSAFGSATNFACNNSFYELINLLTAFGLGLLSHAASLLTTSSPSREEEIDKATYSLCCEAAGAFQAALSLSENHLLFQLQFPVECHPAFLKALVALSLAQGQEVGATRAMKKAQQSVESRPPELCTKLLHQATVLYEESLSFLKQVETKEESYVSLKRYVSFKCLLSQSYTWVGMACVLNKQNDNGGALLAMQQAQVSLKEAAAQVKAVKCFKHLCEVHGREVESKVLKFQKENELIYHAKVATESCNLLPPQPLARPKTFVFPQKSDLWTPETVSKFVLSS
eukprot:NODE_355_length_2393_cov_30.210324_g330_i0.p1 GENE.NODE_355_length_2393_cov_30.210324_g330_i0~~NODE_355_length_2393_cov_30.210324_g330_i0.p1  ORF type:complete len:384 (+),score=55.49 NODE_355_length_2393_cov_30.210324_g330_i0:47-1198(+)